MFSDKIFRNCLILSLVAHAIFLFNINPFKMFPKMELSNSKKEIEVTYYKKIGNLLPKATIGTKEKIAGSVTPHRKIGSLEERRKPIERMRKPLSPDTKKIYIPKMVITQDKWQIFHKSKDLSDQPSYLKYYNLVRAEIERAANAKKPHGFKIGEVNLIFTILNSGDLKNVDLVDKEQASDDVLKHCALDSVYAASPFPPFTGDMKEGQVTLQLTISFQK